MVLLIIPTPVAWGLVVFAAAVLYLTATPDQRQELRGLVGFLTALAELARRL